MAILNVPITTDFSAQNLLNIDTINMSGAGVTATFSSAQFGLRKILPNVAINNSGDTNSIIVKMSGVGTFSAAGWSFLAPFDSGDRIFIQGTNGIDTIFGSSGSDVIGTLGGNLDGGADHLFGGAGDDTLFSSKGVINGSVFDGGIGTDILNLTKSATSYDLRATTIDGVEVLGVAQSGITVFMDHAQLGAGLINSVRYVGPLGNLPQLRISGGDTNLSSFDASGQVRSITITGDPVVANTLIGSQLNDSIIGGSGADTLVGNQGTDTLTGGPGNDTFLFGASNTPNSGDIIEGGVGFADRILLTGSLTFDLSLLNISRVERLQFGGGPVAAFMIGSQFSGPGDITTIVGGADTDTLNVVGQTLDLTALAFSTWTDGVDILKIVGTAAADNLTGSSVGDTFDAADLTAVIDVVAGGLGNDIYVVDQGDTINETTGNGGADRVRVLSTYVLASGRDIEFLETADALGITAIDLTGNALAQTITGNNGANRLDSGGGVDTLVGLSGSDVYFVRALGTIITETAGQGAVDIVRTAVSFALTAANDIEQMSTTVNADTTAINLTGNAVAQIITGNAGANRLDGRGGADKLNGAVGADTFVFSTALAATNVDIVGDYSVADDKIELKSSIFTGLLNGALDPTAFAINATGLAGDASDRVIYQSNTGFLFFDTDGLGGATGIKFAVLTAGLAMVSTEFVVA